MWSEVCFWIVLNNQKTKRTNYFAAISWQYSNRLFFWFFFHSFCSVARRVNYTCSHLRSKLLNLLNLRWSSFIEKLFWARHHDYKTLSDITLHLWSFTTLLSYANFSTRKKKKKKNFSPSWELLKSSHNSWLDNVINFIISVSMFGYL